MSLNGDPMEDEDFNDPDGNGEFEEDPFAALERVVLYTYVDMFFPVRYSLAFPPSLPTPAKKEKQTRAAGA